MADGQLATEGLMQVVFEVFWQLEMCLSHPWPTILASANPLGICKAGDFVTPPPLLGNLPAFTVEKCLPSDPGVARFLQKLLDKDLEGRRAVVNIQS